MATYISSATERVLQPWLLDALVVSTCLLRDGDSILLAQVQYFFATRRKEATVAGVAPLSRSSHSARPRVAFVIGLAQRAGSETTPGAAEHREFGQPAVGNP